MRHDRTAQLRKVEDILRGAALDYRIVRITHPGHATQAAFWMTLPGFRPATVRLDADGRAFEWRAHNVVVANCKFYGGGMQISPESEPDDGALDVLVMVGRKSGAFTMLPKVYKGTHLPTATSWSSGPAGCG